MQDIDFLELDFSSYVPEQRTPSLTEQRKVQDERNHAHHLSKLRHAAVRLSGLAGHKVTVEQFEGRTENQLLNVIYELQNYLRNLPEKTEQAPPAKKRHRRRKPKSQKVEA